MPASKKQRTTNRANARKSSGPTSAEGKAVASQNAVKHGLYARDIIIDSPHYKEDPAEYEHLRQSLFDELKPVGLFQEYLVRKIANCLWRSRRAAIAETARINRNLDDIESDYNYKHRIREILGDTPDPGETPSKKSRAISQLVGIKSIPDQSFSMNLLRYEMRLDRQLTRAYRLLSRLQRGCNSPSDKEKNGDP
jgi:hypothetical protein